MNYTKFQIETNINQIQPSQVKSQIKESNRWTLSLLQKTNQLLVIKVAADLTKSPYYFLSKQAITHKYLSYIYKQENQPFSNIPINFITILFFFKLIVWDLNKRVKILAYRKKQIQISDILLYQKERNIEQSNFLCRFLNQIVYNVQNQKRNILFLGEQDV
ncbi:unnamed protein product [Paramecium octaurelia]|uniref:Uncharacterized protein n=1 Tax=Paramecium octaurelia TaxID=43137 RepID=A0A8S1WVW6_PAROT|nr:unnamed protein product [Paramecium octaurelia]